MKTTNRNWELLTKPFNEELRDALQQQHHAAQFIALVGKYLIPNKPDDSHTNMEFIPETKLLRGQKMPNGFRVALDLENMILKIYSAEDSILKEIVLGSKSKHLVFEELKKSLLEVQIDASALKESLHYEIPSHAVNEGKAFDVSDKGSFVENAKYRYNAKSILKQVATNFDSSEEVRIWPHHFDTGAYYILSKNEKGAATQTVGIGFAIPDSMVAEPYYYLSFWSEEPIENADSFPTLAVGKWMIPTWSGAILSHSEIINKKTVVEQFELVKSFFKEGLEIIKQHLK